MMRFFNLWASFGLVWLIAIQAANARAAGQREFTVKDDIEAVHFGDPYLDSLAPISFSPDRRYAVVASEHGALSADRPVAELRLYDMTEVRQWLMRQDQREELKPLWTFSSASYKDGPNITDVRWTAEGRSFAFLRRTRAGLNQLCIAEIAARRVEPLTPESQHVTAFDIHDRQHFVYTVLTPQIGAMAYSDRSAVAVVGTSRSLYSILFPENVLLLSHIYDKSELYSVRGKHRVKVLDPATGRALAIHSAGQRALSLSPDGTQMITALSVREVPSEWVSRYPPGFASEAYRLRAGLQDVDALDGSTQVSEYVLISLRSGSLVSLTRAPIADIGSGWLAVPSSGWSHDARWIVLANTFEEVGESTPKMASPCVLALNSQTHIGTCIARVVRSSETDSSFGVAPVRHVRFAPGSSNRVIFEHSSAGGRDVFTYIRGKSDVWSRELAKSVEPALDLTIREGLNQPPELVASDRESGISRVLWNPNPQFGHIQWGKAEIRKWKDQTGHEWEGVLYPPSNFIKGKRYPLVIQNHGFSEKRFEPSGVYPTAFAARGLAGQGLLVLQVRDCPASINKDEGACQVRGYESAIRRLTEEGVVDPGKVGIIGFSRSCYYVLQALTKGKVPFRAASITSGVDEGYLQYMTNVDTLANSLALEADSIIGAAPFGPGLASWFERSPLFNMDKVEVPLQVVAAGRSGLVFEMLEPYATLRYLQKPVDLVLLRDGTHVLTNPAERMISQGGTVDWFRFWLKGEEDPSPLKSSQYVRWRQLRKLDKGSQAGAIAESR